MNAVDLFESIEQMIALLAQDRLAMEQRDMALMERLNHQKQTLCVALETGLADASIVSAMSQANQDKLRQLLHAMDHDAKINAMIAAGAMDQCAQKINWITHLAAHSYGPNGRPQLSQSSISTKA